MKRWKIWIKSVPVPVEVVCRSEAEAINAAFTKLRANKVQTNGPMQVWKIERFPL